MLLSLASSLYRDVVILGLWLKEMKEIKEFVKSVPIIGPLARNVYGLLRRGRLPFPGSREYWELRYTRGDASGFGSCGILAVFKARIVNSFVSENDIHSVIEFGCGDGNQLSLANYPAYLGLDVSRTAIALCNKRFHNDETKSFFLYDPECFVDKHSVFKADLTLSLDVIFHLVEDTVFELYMQHLFSAATRFAIIYSSDTDLPAPAPHVKHRRFSRWVELHLPEWKLLERIPNEYPWKGDDRTGSLSDFFIYGKAGT